MNRFGRVTGLGSRGYKSGDHWVISDRSGKKVRASETQREWNGSIVHTSEFESRHPQDFVKSVSDRITVPNARPRQVDTFIGPLKTTIAATHAAGDTTITVADSTRFASGDRINIMMDDGDTYQAVVLSVPDGTSLTLTVGLPGSTSSGKAVVNRSAVSPSDLE